MPIILWYIGVTGISLIGGGLAAALAFDKADDAADSLLPLVAVAATGAIVVMALKARAK